MQYENKVELRDGCTAQLLLQMSMILILDAPWASGPSSLMPNSAAPHFSGLTWGLSLLLNYSFGSPPQFCPTPHPHKKVWALLDCILPSPSGHALLLEVIWGQDTTSMTHTRECHGHGVFIGAYQQQHLMHRKPLPDWRIWTSNKTILDSEASLLTAPHMWDPLITACIHWVPE